MVKTFLTNEDRQKIDNTLVSLSGRIDNFGGTVEITNNNPTKENTVLTIHTDGEEVAVYTADELDEIIRGLRAEIDENTRVLRTEIEAFEDMLVDGNEVAY